MITEIKKIKVYCDICLTSKIIEAEVNPNPYLNFCDQIPDYELKKYGFNRIYKQDKLEQQFSGQLNFGDTFIYNTTGTFSTTAREKVIYCQKCMEKYINECAIQEIIE